LARYSLIHRETREGARVTGEGDWRKKVVNNVGPSVIDKKEDQYVVKSICAA